MQEATADTDSMLLYTVNHKKRGSIFLTITLANLNFYIILIVKKFYMRL